MPKSTDTSKARNTSKKPDYSVLLREDDSPKYSLEIPLTGGSQLLSNLQHFSQSTAFTSKAFSACSFVESCFLPTSPIIQGHCISIINAKDLST